ncbi:BEL1-like homeodomain protein 7 isoform X1 [Helianthus annuus]|uniref:BEL1-like homeodomain protein 7 isoform X1 n=1 Tax=Helianthus annuus TaxID=4232 RepID=UPI000B8F8D42|nr:BEL1-like homeodomain protein 7 isoform X1 [Helianthus annuus]XP_021989499.1 BEL1-like homeodomain protein 7 isoform X1 [Helianthus annuus]
MSSYTLNERFKQPVSLELESLIPTGNITMYMSQQNNMNNNNTIFTDVLDSNVVTRQEFGKMLLMDQMGSHVPPSGIQFCSDQYQNPNGFLSLADESTQDSEGNSYGIGNVVYDSKYLKAVQQLLDEIVHINKDWKQQDFKQECMNDSQQVLMESEYRQDSSQLSAVEKQDLEDKMIRLSSMLKEVDRRYKQYYHQMQIIISSFEVLARCGAAKAYTSLALQTISSRFRCLRDAIDSQIKVISRSLGGIDSNGNGIAISRLKFVDQQLRREKYDQKFGMMDQHIWRPQRGLPESCVSVLRAWLFEHFLHPRYPKDSEKTMLARQTGLTKSQVSNWFINARVRLWKPMVEEIYQEESADAAMDSNSSSETTPKKTSLDQPRDMNPNAASSYQALHMKTSGAIVNGLDVITNPIIDKGVSLTLRLQHTDNSGLPVLSSVENHHHGLVDPRDVICDTPNL